MEPEDSSYLRQKNQVLTRPSCFLNNHFNNIILSNRSLPIRSPRPHVSPAPPPHSIQFDVSSNNIWRVSQNSSLLILCHLISETLEGVIKLITNNKYLATWLDIHLFTYSMVQSPSWEANWFAASQEIPCISRNSNVHYRTHKRPPPVSILGQPNPVHIPTSHFLEIHPNIIHPSTPRSPQWSPSLQFPHQDPIHPLSSPITHTHTHRVYMCIDYIINRHQL